MRRWHILFLYLIFSTTVNRALQFCLEEDAKKRNATKGLYEGPYFEDNLATLVVAQMGSTSYLPCIVCQVNGKSVSWIRKRDAHILTVDRYTFVADLRYQTYHMNIEEQFSLEIRFLQPRDSGLYECQVGTEPKMSHIVNLVVISPNVTITPSPDMIVKCGSIINITCSLTPTSMKPDFMFWYHNGSRVIDYKTNKMLRIKQTSDNDTLYSTLTIFNANLTHTGNYTCHPSNMNSTMTYLHVIDDAPASMSKNKAVSASLPFSFWTGLFWVTILTSMSPLGLPKGTAVILLSCELVSTSSDQLQSLLMSLFDRIV